MVEIDDDFEFSDVSSCDDEGMENVQLGFAVRPEEVTTMGMHDVSDWSTWDGGQIGGKVSWLHPNSSSVIRCTCCQDPMVFLIQVRKEYLLLF